MNLPFTPASAREARRALGGWLNELGYDNGIVDDAQLVITELVANSVRHARPLPGGILSVAWHREGLGLFMTVRDGGSNTMPKQVTAPPGALGGRGLTIVDALASWSVVRERAGSAVHVKLDLP